MLDDQVSCSHRNTWINTTHTGMNKIKWVLNIMINWRVTLCLTMLSSHAVHFEPQMTGVNLYYMQAKYIPTHRYSVYGYVCQHVVVLVSFVCKRNYLLIWKKMVLRLLQLLAYWLPHQWVSLDKASVILFIYLFILRNKAISAASFYNFRLKRLYCFYWNNKEH